MPGASEGILYFVTPQWDKIATANVILSQMFLVFIQMNLINSSNRFGMRLSRSVFSHCRLVSDLLLRFQVTTLSAIQFIGIWSYNKIYHYLIVSLTLIL